MDTPDELRKTPRQQSVELWRTAHDEWCAHDETFDGIECDCHLSVISSLRKRLGKLEEQNVILAIERADAAETGKLRNQLAASEQALQRAEEMLRLLPDALELDAKLWDSHVESTGDGKGWAERARELKAKIELAILELAALALDETKDYPDEDGGL